MVRSGNGFTLLEVVAAMAVFAFGFMAVSRLQISTVQSNTYSADLAEANRLAQDKVEELMALDFNSTELSDANNNGLGGLNSPRSGATTADHTQTLGRFIVYHNCAPNQPMANNTTVRVLVSWVDKRNATHWITLDFVKGNVF